MKEWSLISWQVFFNFIRHYSIIFRAVKLANGGFWWPKCKLFFIDKVWWDYWICELKSTRIRIEKNQLMHWKDPNVKKYSWKNQKSLLLPYMHQGYCTASQESSGPLLAFLPFRINSGSLTLLQLHCNCIEKDMGNCLYIFSLCDLWEKFKWWEMMTEFSFVCEIFLWPTSGA